MAHDIAMFILFSVLLVLLSLPLGSYISNVFSFRKTFLDPLLVPLEKLIYRLTFVKKDEKMNWKGYVGSILCFSVINVVFIYVIEELQGILPFNPSHLGPVQPWHLALNTAVSFMTNTNWQAYSGETTMSYFTQMAGLAVQQFVSTAAGIAVAIALIRGFASKLTDRIGNFWVDMTRAILWILLPLCIVFTLLLVSQGVIQNFHPNLPATALEGTGQTIPMGPLASMLSITLLGTNGGGFFNANSAHPFANPSPFTNFLEALSIFLIPAALVIAYGRMVEDKRQGYVILSAMMVLFLISLFGVYMSELHGNPLFSSMGLEGHTAMEGKEVRFGIGGSALFATVTTAASCGAVNCMHDSLTPLGGFFPMLQIMLGECIFGGAGTGFYSMIEFVVLTVFIIGLMVGRTPEYVGKKIEAGEMKMAVLAVLIPSVTILLFSALSLVIAPGVSSITNPGPHGLSQILYACASAAGNNGSAFAGLNANTLHYNLMTSLAMLTGRFGVIIPMLVIAGTMAAKKKIPESAGTFSTRGFFFTIMIVGMVLIAGALTFFPALMLGPILEHMQMHSGIMY
ncbi:MAG: potassium-transporting ATPase subunit KdpA [Candidatus Xenobiia bacterium LiM19]